MTESTAPPQQPHKQGTFYHLNQVRHFKWYAFLIVMVFSMLASTNKTNKTMCVSCFFALFMGNAIQHIYSNICLRTVASVRLLKWSGTQARGQKQRKDRESKAS